jgi:hypothetical protein
MADIVYESAIQFRCDLPAEDGVPLYIDLRGDNRAQWTRNHVHGAVWALFKYPQRIDIRGINYVRP